MDRVCESVGLPRLSPQVKHLDYDDLHVTTSIQEEGLRGGKEKKSQGLEMSDARWENVLIN